LQSLLADKTEQLAHGILVLCIDCITFFARCLSMLNMFLEIYLMCEIFHPINWTSG